MNSLIIYYSLTGHVDSFVGKLKNVTGFETLQLKTVSELQYKGILRYIIGGFQAVTGYNPALKPITKNLDQFDHFIFVTPVWASTYVPAFNSLMDQYDFSHKKITVISSSKDPKTKVYEKFDLKLPLSTITRHYKIVDREPEDQKNIINQLLNQLKNQAQPYE